MNVAIFSPNFGSISEPWILSAQEIMKKTGNNTGNLAYWYSVPRMFDAKFHIIQGMAHAIALKGKVDLFVFPASNQLNPNSDMGAIADIVEELDVPCLVIGLGAQSDNEATFPELKNGTLRFLQSVAKRSPAILCRGEYTKRLLNNLGIFNVVVGGCSTVFINGNKNLGVRLEDKFNRPISRLNIASGQVNPAVQQVERDLLNLLESIGCGSYTIQHPPILFKALMNQNLDASEATLTENLAQRFLGVKDGAALVNFLRKFSVFHGDIDSWLTSLSLHSHSVGTRIHGNILALQAETPAVCITTDTRTRELCNVLKVPSVESLTFSDIYNTKEKMLSIFSEFNFSGKEFDNNRLRLANIYWDVFKSLDVKVSKNFKCFIS
ncbi:polysaccharide pyruvyl transferase family protein [Microbulbifer sp. TRSA005]